MKKANSKTKHIPLLGGQQFTKETSSGLMVVSVTFGMTRQPTGGVEEVSSAFTEVAEHLRVFADGIDLTGRIGFTGAGDKA